MPCRLRADRRWHPQYRIAFAPHSAIPRRNPTWAWRDALGDVDDAAIDFKKAIAIAPEYAAAFYYLGRVYACQGRFEEAAAEFERALDKSSRKWRRRE